MLQKILTVFCSQDAKSCYDRISHAALAMGLQRQNIAETAIQTLISTIQRMVHRVRTVFGELLIMYRGSSMKCPNQGIPQGNGIGPPGWSLISTPCLELLQKKALGQE